MAIIQLDRTIDVQTPLGYGKAIAWIDYGSDTNTVWKVILYDSGKVRNFYDDDIIVYANAMDGGTIQIPETWKQETKSLSSGSKKPARARKFLYRKNGSERSRKLSKKVIAERHSRS